MASPNKTRVQVATDPAFSNVVYDVNGAYTTALQIAEEVLPQGVNLYARGMHGHPTTGDSSWSTTVQFKIKLAWSDWDGSANGLEYTLNNNANGGISAIKLTETKIVLAWDYLWICLLTISGSTITTNSVIRADSTQTINNTKIEVIDSSNFIIFYRNETQKGHLFSTRFNVTNDTITKVTTVKCGSYGVNTLRPVLVSTGRILLCCHTEYGVVYGVLINVEGNGIIVLHTLACSSVTADCISVVLLETNKILAVYRDFYNKILISQLITVVGNTVVRGDAVTCHYCNNVLDTTSIGIDDNKVLTCYYDTVGKCTYAVITYINGTTLTHSSKILCNSEIGSGLYLVKVDDFTYLLLFYNYTDSYRICGQVLSWVNDELLINSDIVECTPTVNTLHSAHVAGVRIGDNVFIPYNKVYNSTLFGKVLVDN